MRIILIGNYLPDKQESMIRFTKMLESGFSSAGITTEIWWPENYLTNKGSNTYEGINKWLAYIDKFIIFPAVLMLRRLQKRVCDQHTHFHICDHSNSPYLKFLPLKKTSITCHDVIAIRGGLGYTDFVVPASSFGVVLQKWILHHLSRAKYLAAVSKLTLQQLTEISPSKQQGQHWTVVYNSFNAEFLITNSDEVSALLASENLPLSLPFVLHVGSDLTRKNRKLLLDMLHSIKDSWKGNVCFAGDALEQNLIDHAKKLGIENRVINIIKPQHNVLVALYNRCFAFIFPSFSEGFGWPVIEAQACGAPVIASNINPIPEISGGAALLADPTKPHEFGNALLSLADNNLRTDLINGGLENIRRFSPSIMINNYLKLIEKT